MVDPHERTRAAPSNPPPLPESAPSPPADFKPGHFSETVSMDDGLGMFGSVSVAPQASIQQRAAPRQPALPKQIGDFEIIGELGRGGMGVVYEAQSPRHSRSVALKILGEDATPNDVKRFRIEGRVVARLRHPNIVSALEHDRSDGGQWYMAMELVEGEDLDKRLKRDGPLPRVAATMALQLAEAVEYAHAASVLHRDIKPHNVMVERGQARLTDFGLAKLLDSVSTQLTRTGDLLGTPAYMPPEQARGERRSVDGRSDIYSLGGTLYHMATGVLPFNARSLTALLLKITSETPRPPSALRSSIPPELDAIIMRCMEKEPRKRYQTAGELVQALSEFLGLRPAQRSEPAEPAEPAEAVVQAARASGKVVLAIAALAVFGFLIALFLLLGRA